MAKTKTTKAGPKTKTTAKAASASKAAPASKAAAAKPPTAREIAAAAGIELKPKLKPEQIQRLRKPLPGYVNLLDDVAELIAEDGDELRLDDISPDDLLAVQARQKDLAAREAVLEAVYTTAYQQRLEVDDQGMALLQKIARRVSSRAEENPELPLRYKSLLDFLGTFRGGGRPAKAKPAAEPAQPAEPVA